MRVGGESVTRSDLAVQMAMIAPEHAVPDPPHYKKCVARLQAGALESIPGLLERECRAQYSELQQHALASLITDRWLAGAAHELDVALPGGSLSAQGGAAEARLRRALQRREGPTTQAQLAASYAQNIRLYERPERRYIEIAEHIPSEPLARRILGEAIAQHGIAHLRGGQNFIMLPENFAKERTADVVPWKRAILKAIFSAKPHTLFGPLPLNEQWCFFEVTRVTPRAVKPLAQVRAAVQQRLLAERRRHTLTAFIAAWRRKWTARTDCRPGYVVQKCRQYKGPKVAEAPDSFS